MASARAASSRVTRRARRAPPADASSLLLLGLVLRGLERRQSRRALHPRVDPSAPGAARPPAVSRGREQRNDPRERAPGCCLDERTSGFPGRERRGGGEVDRRDRRSSRTAARTRSPASCRATAGARHAGAALRRDRLAAGRRARAAGRPRHTDRALASSLTRLPKPCPGAPRAGAALGPSASHTLRRPPGSLPRWTRRASVFPRASETTARDDR